MTFNSKGKEKDTKYRELELEELPMLAIEDKIKKDGPSRRTPASSTAPSTPAKSCTDEVSTVSDVLLFHIYLHLEKFNFTVYPGFK